MRKSGMRRQGQIICHLRFGDLSSPLGAQLSHLTSAKAKEIRARGKVPARDQIHQCQPPTCRDANAAREQWVNYLVPRAQRGDRTLNRL